MKKIISTILLGAFLFLACTKQELAVIDDPLALDENSRQYQTYIVERAINSIRTYRFEKLEGIIDRIKDPQEKAKVDALYAEYRAKARNEALYFVTIQKDTLFFLPPETKRDAKNLSVDFEPGFYKMQNQRLMVNSDGVLQGFQNYPNVTSFRVANCFATGIKGLEAWPEMTSFLWNMDFLNQSSFDFYALLRRYPEKEFTPTKLEVDLSQSHKLKKAQMAYVDISDITFPSHRLESFSVKKAGGQPVGGYRPSVIDHNLNNVNADDISVEMSQSASSELTLSNTVNTLSLEGISMLKKLDLKNLKVDKRLVLKTLPDIEEIVLPEVISGRLNIETSNLKKLDLKNVKGLDNIRLVLPDVEELTLPNAITGTTGEIRIEATEGKGLKKLNLKNVKGVDKHYFVLALINIEELILPDGITEEILANSYLLLKQGCIIHNVPDGVDISKYVRYFQ